VTLLNLILGPARETGRGLALDVAVGAVAVGLAVTGGGFLIAAVFWMLARSVGHPAAAAIVGSGLIALAAAIEQVRQAQRRRRQEVMRAVAAVQATARDPLPSLVFDLAYLAGRQFLHRRR
jgi:hypothetical protein